MADMIIKQEAGRTKFFTIDNEGNEKVAGKVGYLKGTSRWAQILKPNQYEKYSIDIYDADEAMLQEFKDNAEDLIDEAEALVKGLKKKVNGRADYTKIAYDDDSADDGKYAGKDFVQFNRLASRGAPKIINIHGDLDPDWKDLVGNGSFVKVGYFLKPYYMASSKMVGVSVTFFAVQVINLVKYKSSGNTGFDDESDDVHAPEVTSKEDAPWGDESDSSNDNGADF